MSIRTAVSRPSGFIPLVMSCAALYVVLRHLVLYGAGPPVQVVRPDEGPEAHIWQILMAGQAPLVAYFALRWLWSDPRGALPVLGLQAFTFLGAAAPVFLLRW